MANFRIKFTFNGKPFSTIVRNCANRAEAEGKLRDEINISSIVRIDSKSIPPIFDDTFKDMGKYFDQFFGGKPKNP